MKVKANQGYLLALYYLTMYEQENELKNELIEIKNILVIETIKICKKHKLNLEREFEKSYDYFVKRYGTDSYEISILSMVLQLIARNPSRDKYKKLTDLALKLNRENILCKDSEVVNTRKAVIGFYTENLKKRKNNEKN